MDQVNHVYAQQMISPHKPEILSKSLDKDYESMPNEEENDSKKLLLQSPLIFSYIAFPMFPIL